MKADLELSLIHDGDSWVCRNDNLEAKGNTLPELDENLISNLRQSGEFAQGSKIRVYMGFDFSTFPTWLRQYHTHYFNRFITVDL